jgi:cytochrome c peroxidase
VTSEVLAPDVLVGKQLFHDAADDRLARDNYMSCASCHNEAGHDGRVWDFSSLGEGLRNTIDLTGKGIGHGRIHWTGNFDEVQDFEGQIRLLAGGTGLINDSDFDLGDDPLASSRAGLSVDLDALASYLTSLDGHPPSPLHDGSLSSPALAGESVYQRENCASCHSGDKRTDSESGVVHDIGTISINTGFASSGPVYGIDTPTLDFLWATAPYLHDGSALSIAEAILAHDNVNVTEEEAVELEFYLLESDAGRP